MTKNIDLITTQEKLIDHIIYGDIDEMPLSILGDECPIEFYYNKMDSEQQTRLACAATIKAFFENKLHKSGYLFN